MPAVQYPPLFPLLAGELLRLSLQAFWMVMFYHFVTVPFVAPALFDLARSPGSPVVRFLESNSAAVWVVQKITPALARRGLDVGDLVLFALGSTLIHIAAYVLMNGTYALLNHFRLLQEYRIPPKSRAQIPPRSLVANTLFRILRTFFIAGPLALPVLMFISNIKTMRTLDAVTSWDASFGVQVCHFVAAQVTNHVTFYLAHRLFHENEWLYKTFHKVHHEYKTSISIAAEHAVPVEQVLANFTPTIVYYLANSNHLPLAFWFTWLVARLHETFEAHSSYDFRDTLPQQLGLLCGTAAHHCHHHSMASSGAYSNFYVDCIFGTDDEYLSSKNVPCAPAQEGKPRS